MAFVLPHNLTYCWLGSQAVFLDIERDRYFALGPRGTAMIRKLERSEPLLESDRETIAMLLDEGVLIPDERGVIAPCVGIEARECLPAQAAAMRTSIKVIPALLTDLMVARRLIRRKPLGSILTDISKRRNQAEAKGRTAPLSVISEIGSGFDTLEGIVGALDQCLPRSIALMRNLIRRGFAPRMVFGVMWRPFAAHCWVQIDGNLVGERLENVQNFVPVRVI